MAQMIKMMTTWYTVGLSIQQFVFSFFLLQKTSNLCRQSDPRLVDMETAENELLKREVETLKRENAELRETNNKLKLSLGKASRRRPNKPQPVATAYGGVDTELQQKLNRTTKQLSDVQERLTLLEQVNAATQRRELRQEGALKNLPSDSFYEELRFDPTEEYVYTRRQLITHTGCTVLEYFG